MKGPALPPTPVAASAGGPTVSFTGGRAQVAGEPAATSALGKVRVPPGCSPAVERSDAHLVSVVWRCKNTLYAATVSLGGRALTLGDILDGGYASYLSSTASAQFAAQGQDHVPTTDLTTWYLTPAALAVAFPAGVVSFPLASLRPYLKDPSSL